VWWRCLDLAKQVVVGVAVLPWLGATVA